MGAKHQASYDELYQDGVIKVTDLAYSHHCYEHDHGDFQDDQEWRSFRCPRRRFSGHLLCAVYRHEFPVRTRLPKACPCLGKLTYDGAGGSRAPWSGMRPDVSNTPGLIVLYGTDEVVGQLPARIRQGKYPFAALLKTGSGVDYVSPANASGCEKCHTVPYLKHGYIYGEVNHDPGNRLLHLQSLPPGQRRGRPSRMAALWLTIRRWLPAYLARQNEVDA